jgi:hypothetical protein
MHTPSFRFPGPLLMLFFLLVSPFGIAAAPQASPAQLTAVATLGGSSSAVAANASFAVVGDGHGIVVYDGRGATPAGVYRLMLPGFAQSIALAEDLLAVAADTTVFLYRLDGPAPLPLSRVPAGAGINHLAIAADRLYLATRAGLTVFDIANPTRPVQLGAFPRSLGVRRVIGDSTTVYALAAYEAIEWAGLSSVLKIDVTNPRAPRLLHESAVGGQFSNAVALAQHGEAIFVAGDMSGPHMTGAMTFEIWRFAATTLTPETMVSFPATLSGENATDLLASDSHLFALSTLGGLSVIDPTTLARIAQLRTPNRLMALTIDGSRAFAAAYEGGLQPFNLADPVAPAAGPFQALLGPTSAVGWSDAALITLSPDHATPGQVLSSFDLRTTNNPQLGDQVIVGDIASLTFDVGNQGTHLLYDRSTDLTRLVDTRTAGRIRLSGTLSLGPSDAIAAHDQHAYIAISGPGAQDGALVIFDLSDFSAPREVGQIALHSAVTDLATTGDRLYLLDAGQNLQIYTLDDPAAPDKVGEVAVPERYRHVVVAGSVAYVARMNGVQIVDVADPRNPMLGAVIADELANPRLAVSAGRLAIVSTFCTAACTLQMYDLADPLAPTLQASADLPPPFTTIGGLAGFDGRFALARDSHGITIYTVFTETLWLPLS